MSINNTKCNKFRTQNNHIFTKKPTQVNDNTNLDNNIYMQEVRIQNDTLV